MWKLRVNVGQGQIVDIVGVIKVLKSADCIAADAYNLDTLLLE